MNIIVELTSTELQNMQISADDLQTSIELELEYVMGPEGEPVSLPNFSVQVKVTD